MDDSQTSPVNPAIEELHRQINELRAEIATLRAEMMLMMAQHLKGHDLPRGAMEPVGCTYGSDFVAYRQTGAQPEEQRMNSFDMREYLVAKAEAEGLLIAPYHEGYEPNCDRITYLLSRTLASPRAYVAISISGLEQIQNATEKSIKNLLDGRFSNALKTFLNGEKALESKGL